MSEYIKNSTFGNAEAPTKQRVLDMNKQLDADGITVKQGFLEKAAGQKFYNLSPFTFETLLYVTAYNIKWLEPKMLARQKRFLIC